MKKMNQNPKNSRNSSKPVSQPVAKARMTKQKGPSIQGGEGTVRVRHREYIGDISGSPDFEVKSYAINPGLMPTFPWLGRMGTLYESYSVESFRAIFETEAPTSKPGVVILAVDYDASDDAPVSKIQAMNYKHSVKGPSWSEELVFKSDPKDLHKRKQFLTRDGALAAGLDPTLYDVCNLFVCTSGQDDSTQIGGLSIEYDIILNTPQLGDPSLVGISFAGFAGSTNAAPAASKYGPLAVSAESTGTTTSVTTLTFQQPFQGLGVINFFGSGLNLMTFSGAGEIQSLYTDGTGLQTIGTVYLNMQPGDYLTITEANTSITVSRIRLAPFGLANF